MAAVDHIEESPRPDVPQRVPVVSVDTAQLILLSLDLDCLELASQGDVARYDCELAHVQLARLKLELARRRGLKQKADLFEKGERLCGRQLYFLLA